MAANQQDLIYRPCSSRHYSNLPTIPSHAQQSRLDLSAEPTCTDLELKARQVSAVVRAGKENYGQALSMIAAYSALNADQTDAEHADRAAHDGSS
jgi:hypothetical protein